MSTLKDLYKEYKKKICTRCNKKGDCSIRIFNFNGITYTKCVEYESKEPKRDTKKCMENKCKTCKDYYRCFGGGESAERKTDR